jgi:hypothetical protein
MIEHGKLPKNMALNSIVGFGISQSAARDALPRMTPRRQLQIRTLPAGSMTPSVPQIKTGGGESYELRRQLVWPADGRAGHPRRKE